MKILLSASGKGGTGKTSLMAAVAAELARMGRRVLVVDGDCCLRNLDLVLGFTESPPFHFMEVAMGQVPLAHAVCTHPILQNLDLLTAPVFMPYILPRYMQNLRDVALEAGYDYLLLDGPAGMPDELLAYASIADRALVVCTADAVSIRGGERAARMLEATSSHLQCALVVNRVRKRLIFRGAGCNIDDAMDMTGLPLLGIVPEDEQVIVCAAMGQSIHTKRRSNAAKAYANIAHRLDGQVVRLGFGR